VTSRHLIGPLDQHIWLCRSDQVSSSAQFSRKILSMYASTAPDDWQFSVGEHGKPRIENANTSLEFNLSHSRDWLVCAVTDGCAVGIDIEYCEPARDFSKLAQRFFMRQEYEALNALPESERGSRFYDLWTLKEAGVKVNGAALGNQLPSLGFALLNPVSGAGQNEPAQICELSAATCKSALPLGNPDLNARVPQARHYILVDLPGNYRLASCVLHASTKSQRLTFYEWGGADVVQPARHVIKACSATSHHNNFR